MTKGTAGTQEEGTLYLEKTTNSAEFREASGPKETALGSHSLGVGQEAAQTWDIPYMAPAACASDQAAFPG